jgi:LPXTG-motif cell wall-anchored protein
MTRRNTLPAIAVALLLLTFPVAAAAQDDNSGIGAYTESPPSSEGTPPEDDGTTEGSTDTTDSSTDTSSETTATGTETTEDGTTTASGAPTEEAAAATNVSSDGAASGQLPATGLETIGLVVTGIALVGAGLLIRRRLASA